MKDIHLSTLIYWGVGVWFATLVLEGTKVTSGMLAPCGTVIAVLSVSLTLFDKWLWSFRFLHPWFVDRPYLRGTWKGTLISNYVNPTNKERVPPIEVYLVIRQTYSTLHLRLMTKESASESITSNIPKGEDGLYSVASIYRNTPQLAHRERSPIHHGSLLLRVEGDPVVALSGQYWTDRVTQGEIRFSEKSETCHYSYETAASGRFKALFGPESANAPRS